MEETKIQIGDWVKVIPDVGSEYSEYVEAIATTTEGKTLICLSDGTWVRECAVIKYRVQSSERMKLYELLNETE